MSYFDAASITLIIYILICNMFQKKCNPNTIENLEKLIRFELIRCILPESIVFFLSNDMQMMPISQEQGNR